MILRTSDLPQSTLADFALRPIRPSDLAALHGYLASSEVVEMTGEAPPSAEALRSCVWPEGEATEASAVRLAIALRATDQLLGTVGLHSASSRHRSAEMSFDLSPSAWGRGLATSMAGVVVDWAHDHLKLVRVQATALPTNARSVAVLNRCGFEPEGRLRSFRVLDGVSRDFLVFSHVLP